MLPKNPVLRTFTHQSQNSKGGFGFRYYTTVENRSPNDPTKNATESSPLNGNKNLGI